MAHSSDQEAVEAAIGVREAAVEQIVLMRQVL